MKFSFKAQRVSGEVFDGFGEAKEKFDLSRMMRDKSITIISAEAVKPTGSNWFEKINGIFIRVSLKEKMFFASNLAEMISAGLTLSRALGVMGREAENKKLKGIIDELLADIDKGGSFAAALGRFPTIFSPVFVAMVEAGERSGRMPESLRIVADQMAKSYDLRKKVRGALMYPMVIIIAMVVIGTFMLIYIVPTLAATFKELGAELPFTTQAIIGVSDFIHTRWIITLGIVIGSVTFFVRFFSTALGTRTLSFVLLHMPVMKKITQETNAAITARTLSALVSSGIDIVEALSITEHVLQNPYYRAVIAEAGKAVSKGEPLSAIFAKSEKLYPPFVAEMVSVGEETGKLADMLSKLAIFYENEVDAVTKNLSTIIEPLVMVVVGAGVAFFALSMIQPLYSIGNNL